MINDPMLNEKQAAVVKAMRTHFGKKTVVSRTELVAFMHDTYKQAYAPDFIVKNEAFKAKDKDGTVLRGMYHLPAAVVVKEKKKAAAVKTVTKKATKPAVVVKKITGKKDAPTTLEVEGSDTKPKSKQAAERHMALLASKAAVMRLEGKLETEKASAAN